MSEFKQYNRKSKPSEMRPYAEGEDMSGISVSETDLANWNNVEPGMISRNPDNHTDQWYVAKKWFEDNFETGENNSGKDWQGMYNELLKALHYHYDPESSLWMDQVEMDDRDLCGYNYGVRDGQQILAKSLLKILQQGGR